MDWKTVRIGAVLAWVGSAPAWGLDFGTDTTVRSATFELYAPGAFNGAKGLVGTAFAIGANRFVTTAHLLDSAAGSRFGHPLVVDARHVEYPIADILQYSEQHDYVIFTLKHPPRVRPLEVQSNGRAPGHLYFSGWRLNGAVTTERGSYTALTSEWLRFSGPVWGAAGGGPVINESGQVIGIVQGVSLNGEPNYAVPIDVLSNDPTNTAQLHGMELLRQLMPTVSAVQPLLAAIPLPLAWDDFSREVQQLRHAYYDKMVGPLLEATRQRFVLTGETSADTCSFLNGGDCQCKPRADATGELVMSEPPRDGDSQMVAGVGVVRVSDPVDNTSRHLKIALRSPARSERPSSELVRQKDAAYVDFHNRGWRLRTWVALDRDQEVLSMERPLDGGSIVLTRSVPTALDYAAQLQLEFIANLVYYQCEELSGEGIARLAFN
ncbi:MAG: trypsin-like peptidase domain-containing protein [Proteobacteria bacterium]|nr:trypsin-like peptidase domain-containing protein [Pseudomonadota bacterium]